MSRLSRFALFLLAACSEPGAPPTVDPPPPLDGGQPGDGHDPGTDPRCLSFKGGVFRFGTTGRDEARDVVVTATGSILVAGFEDGRATSTGEIVDSRGIVLEYAPDLGGFRQRALLDTSGTDAIEALAIDRGSGRTWVAARTTGSIADLTTYGGNDVVIAALTASGLSPRARGFDFSSELPGRLAAGSEGLLAVAGFERRPTLHDTRWIDPFLAVYESSDAHVAPQWRTTRRAIEIERYTTVDVSDSTVVVGGNLEEGDGQGMFVIARDRDAGVLWQRRLSAAGTDAVAAVQLLPDGDVLWAGTTGSKLGDRWFGGTDLVIGRLDGATGATIFLAQYGSPMDDHARDMVAAADGRIFVAATTTSAAAGLDAMLVVLSASGDMLGREQWSGSGDDEPTALDLDPCGGVAIVGHTAGDLAGPGHGDRDGFVIVTHHPQ